MSLAWIDVIFRSVDATSDHLRMFLSVSSPNSIVHAVTIYISDSTCSADMFLDRCSELYENISTHHRFLSSLRNDCKTSNMHV